MFIQLRKRDQALTSPLLTASRLVGSVLIALCIGSILILFKGGNVFEAYGALIYGAFGNANNLSETIVKTTPLLLAALGIVVAYRCQIWNIGSEGQIYFGALGAVVIGLYVEGLPWYMHLVLMVLAGFAGGMFWGIIPGILRAKWEANEILVTVMMNYIAILFVSYMCHEPLREPGGWIPQTAEIANSARLPVLLSQTRLHGGIFLALFCTLVVYILLSRTTLGYQIRAVGASPGSALYGGISVKGNIVIAMAISGGLAGLAGMSEVSGIHYRLMDEISPGYGYNAIVVALLGGLTAGGAVVSSVLFAALMVGAESMQRKIGLPVSIVYIIEGLIILFALATEILVRYSVTLTASKIKKGTAC